MTQIDQALAGLRSRNYLLRASLLFVLVACVAAAIPLVQNAWLYALVLSMGLCWAVPFWFQWHQGTLDFFEPIHTVGFVYLIYFGFGALWTISDPTNVAYDRYILPYIPLATLVCLLGYLALLAGYYGPWKGRRQSSRTEEYPRGMLFVLIPAMAGFMGFLAQALWYRAGRLGLGLSALFSSLGQLAPLFIFAWALAWLLYFSGRATRLTNYLLWCGLVPATAIIIADSMNNKSMIASLAVVPLVAYWYARRRLPWVPLTILVLVVVFVIFPFNNTFRQLDDRIDAGKRVALTSEIIGHWSAGDYIDRSMGTFMVRMALINSVAVVIRDVPRWVPYAHGRTMFMPILTMSIPRALWPDKPELRFGREFGETFRVVHILDRETHIAATVPGELYWNFSIPGVLFGMAVWGVGLRLYYRRYGEVTELDPVRRAIHLALLIQFMHFESGIAGPTVMLVRTLLVLEAYRLVGLHFHLIESWPAGTKESGA